MPIKEMTDDEYIIYINLNNDYKYANPEDKVQRFVDLCVWAWNYGGNGLVRAIIIRYKECGYITQSLDEMMVTIKRKNFYQDIIAKVFHPDRCERMMKEYPGWDDIMM
jgi:hypothetical protein